MNQTFENIGGYSIQKDEAKKVADFFNNYEMYTSKGARLPKGILFYGQPGTGKTLFAKAIANESKVPMFPLTTDEFYKESNISSAIKKVFEEAKSSAPSIIFIDELDSIVNCDRGYSKQESDKQREALRALLTEIDKIVDSDVLVIATANKGINLIPDALVRNGRIEKHIEVGKPDKEDREDILKLYFAKNEIFKNIEASDVASYTADFTGASLETLVNDVLIACITKGKEAVFNDFLEPIEAIKSSGTKSKQDDDNSVVIYHELGHFIADYSLNGRIGMVNVVSYAGSKGRYSMIDIYNDLHSSKRDSYTKLRNDCIIGIAGLVATEVYFGEPYMGASADLEEISKTFMCMCKSGLMGNKYVALFALGDSNYAGSYPDSKSAISQEYEIFLDYCKSRAKDIIVENKNLMDALYKELKDKSVLTHAEIEELVHKLESEGVIKVPDLVKKNNAFKKD